MVIISKKACNGNEAFDLSVLPPCHDALRLHSARANFVVKVWRFEFDEESFTNHGWDENGNI